MKPVIVGLNNPHSQTPCYALFPAPIGCSGWRLWKMLNDDYGISKTEYTNGFKRLNLTIFPQKKSDDLVAKARKLHESFPPGSVVILLGREVQKAFAIPRVLIHPQVRGNGVTYRQIPHPSGRCHFYNDPVNRSLVAMMLKELL